MTPARRVRALSIHAAYRCRHSGACCTSGWAIPVEPEIEDRLRAVLRKGFRSVASLPHGARVVLSIDAQGRCAFLEGGPGSHLCAAHRRLGEDALPSACRHFPRVVTLTPLGVSVTLSHYCPTAAGLLFRAVTPNAERGPDGRTADPALHIVESPPAFPAGWPYEGLDAIGALPPLLRPGVLMDWPSLERWERFAVSVLAEEGRTPEAALDVLSAAVEEARRWTPARGAFGPFFEGVLRSRLGAPSAPVSAGTADSSGLGLPKSLGMTGAWMLVVAAVPQGAAALGSRGAPLGVLPSRGLDEADERWVAPAWPGFSVPICRWLAAKAFASWMALQGEGLRTTVASLRVALGVLRGEAARGSAEAARALDAELLKEAVRRADLLLVHLADPEAFARSLRRVEAAEGPAAAW